MFSPKVLKGGPLGEMVQWADILAALYVLGHDLKISVSVKELHGYVLTSPAPLLSAPVYVNEGTFGEIFLCAYA